MRPKKYKQKETSNECKDEIEKCAVKGCNSSIKDGLNFFEFPKDENSDKLTEIWRTFTQIKDFKPHQNQVVCELHFDPECINKRKKVLIPNSVPTIFYRDGKKVEILYDNKKCEYYGKEAKKMLKKIEKDSKDDQLNRINMIKTLCRFCFKDNKCLPFDNYKSHAINFFEIIDYFEIDKQNEKCFNEIICKSCFKKIVEFDKFRSKCQKSYKKLIEEVKKLNNNDKDSHFVFVKSEPINDPLEEETDFEENLVSDDERSFNYNEPANESNDKEIVVNENNENSKISIFNEQTIDDDSDADSDDTAAFQEILFKKTLSEKIEEAKNKLRTKLQIPKIEKEQEVKIQEFSDDDFGVSNDMSFGNDGFDSSDEEFLSESPAKKQKLDKSIKSEENTSESSKSKIVSKPREKKEKVNDKHKKGKRKFQCFFCRDLFCGSKVYARHNCDRKVKCTYENCDIEFTNAGGYNQHIFHKHGLPKHHKEFCPSCNTIYHLNSIEFNEHCQKCSVENNYPDKEIKCIQCSEVCQNIRIYAAHKLMHENDNLNKVMNKEPAVRIRKKSKYVKKPKNKICDICGKNFDAGGLARHKDNVHLVAFNGQMFYCDLCPIAKPTKRLLQNHVRRTHVIKWHECEICGKMFKNRDTWKKHQIVHTNSKDLNRCDICPTSPGFVTQTELKKHMANYHGGDQPVRKYACNVCGNAYSRDDLLVRHLANVHHLTENNYTEDIIRQLMKN
ncbi:hypothetical protein PVAND_002950 [Polypedilum vanderplanki]|uniref:Zinc finger protein n=1 Tax=Polypedilum vanderplanki TaxID=319348 RepID=A0A9J6BTF6_POLVA|nr:hypothetical protein PVAND_002950 [Polypedilum vanderplanki]